MTSLASSAKMQLPSEVAGPNVPGLPTREEVIAQLSSGKAFVLSNPYPPFLGILAQQLGEDTVNKYVAESAASFEAIYGIPVACSCLVIPLFS